jgi:hypothetical protein
MCRMAKTCAWQKRYNENVMVKFQLQYQKIHSNTLKYIETYYKCIEIYNKHIEKHYKQIHSNTFQYIINTLKYTINIL